jgi:hypothetical protein
MKTDAAVEKLKNSFSTAACKTLRVSHSFHRLGEYESKQQNRTDHLLQKPDIFTCY